MTQLSRAAKRRAKNRAEDLAKEYGDQAAERARDELLSDEMWCWLVEAADRAGDYGHARCQELRAEDDVPTSGCDELKRQLSTSELELADARELREDQLLSEVFPDAE